MSSPHTWGCFRAPCVVVHGARVFPTHVGVFRVDPDGRVTIACLPHTRGGVSSLLLREEERQQSSPHTWGCFRVRAGDCHVGLVFPTHVGVFPGDCCLQDSRSSLPHTRGGVSVSSSTSPHALASSPHTWGCFPPSRTGQTATRVFPTHVGVFRASSSRSWRRPRLPHTRGGVSDDAFALLIAIESSPHTWGCFRPERREGAEETVFPTHVGVFLCRGDDEEPH